MQWQKDENWILEDPKIARTFEKNVATLRIPACEASHSGKYTCQVVNEAGQEKCFAVLTVQGISKQISYLFQISKVPYFGIVVHC